MTIYIDKVFFDEFNCRNDLDDEIVQDFRKFFFKKVRGVEIVINLTSRDELKKLSQQQELYNDLLEINPSSIVKPNWKTEVLNDKSIFTGNPIKLFLLGNADNCEVFESIYGYLFINNKNLLEKWSPVRWNRDIVELTTGNIENEFTFNSWQILGKEVLPCNELMILDLYILEDNPNQRLSNNLIPLIRQFAKNYRNDRKLNVTIISDRILDSPDEEKYRSLAKAFNYINENIPNLKVIIIHYNKEKIRREIRATDFNPEHDREIYTNYLKLKCGSGWNIFRDDGTVNHRTTINIQSLFRNDARKAACIAWDNLAFYWKKIGKGETQVLPGRFDNSGNLLTHTSYYHIPVDGSSTFLKI